MENLGLTFGTEYQCAILVADSPELAFHFHAGLCGEIVKSMSPSCGLLDMTGAFFGEFEKSDAAAHGGYGLSFAH